MIGEILTGLSIGGTIVGAAAGVGSKIYQQHEQQKQFESRMDEMTNQFRSVFGIDDEETEEQ